MGNYKIKIEYSTGNSLETYDSTDYLEFTFNDINNAKENLNRIKEHYEMYKSIEYDSKTNKYELFNKNKNKEWFVNVPKLFCISKNVAISESDKKKLNGDWEERPDDYYAQYCLNFKMDNGNNVRINAFWCGYFETLYSAEIEIDNSDMKIKF
jgi:hypothetical protein